VSNEPTGFVDHASSGVRESYLNPRGLPCRLEVITTGVRVSLLNRKAATEEAERLKRAVKELQTNELKREEEEAAAAANIAVEVTPSTTSTTTPSAAVTPATAAASNINMNPSNTSSDEMDSVHILKEGDDIPNANFSDPAVGAADPSEIKLLSQIVPRSLQPFFYRFCPVTSVEIISGEVVIGSHCLPVLTSVTFSRARLLHLITPPPKHIEKIDLYRSWVMLRALDARVTMTRNPNFKGQLANVLAAEALRVESFREELQANVGAGVGGIASAAAEFRDEFAQVAKDAVASSTGTTHPISASSSAVQTSIINTEERVVGAIGLVAVVKSKGIH
jgi:hypothetical protein